MSFNLRRLLAGVMLASLLAQPAGAQSGAGVVERMLTEYARRAEGVENYTLVQDAMGLETLSYFEKEVINGRPVFRLRRSRTAEVGIGGSAEGTLDQLFEVGDQLAARAELLGQERVGGYDVHVLDIPNMDGMGFGRNVTSDSEFEPTRGRLYVDVDTYAPRRIDFEGVMSNQQGGHTVTTSVEMADYRDIEGMLIAHRTVISITGLGAAIDPETRAQFEEMQRELASLPAEQRRMVEAMMADQLAQFETMMTGGDEPLVVRLLVLDVLVNEGPPRG